MLDRKILNVAADLLEQHGAGGVTMRRMAQALGVTPMALYHYFPSRDALLHKVTAAEFDKLNEFAEARGHRGSFRTQIIHIMDGYLDYAFARPRVFDYVFAQPREDARRFPDDFRARRSPTLNPIADIVENAMARGDLKQDDIWEIAMQLWAHVHGYLTLYRAGRFNLNETEFRKLVHRSLRRVLDGLKN
jgi:AcrR family transcriptional regulator